MTEEVALPLRAQAQTSHLPDHETYTADVCPTLSESGGHARPGDNVQSAGTLIPTMVMAHGQGNAEIGQDKSPSLSCNHEAPILFAQPVADPLTAGEQKTYTHEGEKNFRTRNVMAFSSKDHGADVQEECSPTLRAGGHDGSHANAGVPPAICFKPSHFTRDKDGAPSDVSPPLSADADKGDQDTVVLAPAEEWRSTCNCGYEYIGPLSQPCPQCGGFLGMTHGDPIAFDSTQITNKDNRSDPQPGDPCHTLASAAHAPAIAFSSRMRGDDGRGYERPMQSSEEIVGAIDTVTRQCVAIQDVRGIDKQQNGSGVNDEGAAFTLDAHATQGVCAFQQRIARNGRGDTGDVAGALSAQAGSVGQGDSAPCVALSFKPRHYTEKGYKDGAPNDVTGTLTSNASDAGDCSPHVATGMMVRRLTPTECERLQGFPDGWTKIPKRDKTTGCILIGRYAADGPRYKALGNSMATNVMRWIGKRLMQLEALTSKSSTPS